MFKDSTKEALQMQNRLWLKKSPEERARAVFGMFGTARQIIVASLPKDLSEEEFKKQLYERTYGESLPEDFFDKK